MQRKLQTKNPWKDMHYSFYITKTSLKLIETENIFLPSGKSFIWKDFPNNTDSKLPRAVKRNKNTRDPTKPPKIIWNLDEISQLLYICIPENKSTVRIDDKTKEALFVTAEMRI